MQPPRPEQGDGHQKWLQWPPSQWLSACHRNNTRPIQTVFNPSTSHSSQSRAHGLRMGKLELLLGGRERGEGHKASCELQMIEEAQHLRFSQTVDLYHLCLLFDAKLSNFCFEVVQQLRGCSHVKVQRLRCTVKSEAPGSLSKCSSAMWRLISLKYHLCIQYREF